MFRRFRKLYPFWRKSAWGAAGCRHRLFGEVQVTATSTDSVTCLSMLRSGEKGLIVDLGMGRGFISRLASLGFTPGAEVIMEQNFGRGPLLVMVRDTTVALGRREAQHILVQRNRS